MRKFGFVLSLMLGVSTVFAAIYKWTDNQGSIHFSDTPHAGADILVPAASPNSSIPSSNPVVTRKLSLDNFSYGSITVISPENHATIRNNQEVLIVRAAIKPRLFPSDKVQVLIDGEPKGKPQSNLQFSLNGVYRGIHTIAVQIVNSQGQMVMQSQPITIYVFRPQARIRKTVN